VWQLADIITVHTKLERRDFAEAFNISPDRVRIASQGANLIRRTCDDRATARTALGLPAKPTLLLAIGFLSPHKGFDRAMHAFAALRPTGARLYVVGSVFRDDPASRSHLIKLRRLAAKTHGAELREGYLEDEDFDRWIVASDALVLPYRGGWSSNVLERGLLYGRPVIMSRVGGMAEQGAGRAIVKLVDDDADLVNAMSEILASSQQG
jgi:glycosyltransferase involved in cell wall biosynthesis